MKRRNLLKLIAAFPAVIIATDSAAGKNRSEILIHRSNYSARDEVADMSKYFAEPRSWSCHHIFKGRHCKYRGDEDTCNKKFGNCLMPDNFGGFV